MTATAGTLGLGAAVGTAAATNSVTLVSSGSINSAAAVAVNAATGTVNLTSTAGSIGNLGAISLSAPNISANAKAAPTPYSLQIQARQM